MRKVRIRNVIILVLLAFVTQGQISDEVIGQTNMSNINPFFSMMLANEPLRHKRKRAKAIEIMEAAQAGEPNCDPFGIKAGLEHCRKHGLIRDNPDEETLKKARLEIDQDWERKVREKAELRKEVEEEEKEKKQEMEEKGHYFEVPIEDYERDKEERESIPERKIYNPFYGTEPPSPMNPDFVWIDPEQEKKFNELRAARRAKFGGRGRGRAARPTVDPNAAAARVAERSDLQQRIMREKYETQEDKMRDKMEKEQDKYMGGDPAEIGDALAQDLTGGWGGEEKPQKPHVDEEMRGKSCFEQRAEKERIRKQEGESLVAQPAIISISAALVLMSLTGSGFALLHFYRGICMMNLDDNDDDFRIRKEPLLAP